MTSVSQGPEYPFPFRSAAPQFLAVPLLALACVCTTACQLRVPASTSTSTTSAMNSTDVTPQSPNENEGPTVSGTPSADERAVEPEISPAPTAEEKQPIQLNEQAIPITFDDLKLEMEKDTVFEPAMLTDRVKELDGRRVRIRGFIFPSFQQTGITNFPLIKNLQCKFGPGGQAHHIVLVEMKPGLKTDFTIRPIAVEGVLSVKPMKGLDGNTWALYHMVGEGVE